MRSPRASPCSAPASPASPPRTTSSTATPSCSRRPTCTAGTPAPRSRDGFTWDDGPHISFTGNEYVRELFAESVGGAYEECPIHPSNWFRGHWIEHPAQTHLYQVPEPLRTECLDSFLASRDLTGEPANYQEWLHQSMGPVFAETFPAAYTRKYWTTDPSNLDTDWIGTRVLKPDVDDVVNGAKGPLPRPTYYVAGRDARYPSRGGFMGYTHHMAEGADIRYGKRLERIDLGARRMSFRDGSTATYERLVSTIPLPVLVAASTDAPDDVRDAATVLRCTNFLRVDVAAKHPTRREELWMYVYDEDKLSVRISITENFAPSNAPPGRTGIQVEVYGSEYRAVPTDHDEVRRRVVDELVEMGLVDAPDAVESVNVTFVPQGNPIFDLQRRDAMRTISGPRRPHGRGARGSLRGVEVPHDRRLRDLGAACGQPPARHRRRRRRRGHAHQQSGLSGRASRGASEEALDHVEVLGAGHVDVARVAGHDDHPPAAGGDELRVLERVGLAGVGVAQRLRAERVRRLDQPGVVVGDGRGDHGGRVDPFDRLVEHDAGRGRVGAVAHRGDDGVEQRRRRERVGRIVDHDDLRGGGDRGEPGAHRGRPGRATRDDGRDRRTFPRRPVGEHEDHTVAGGAHRVDHQVDEGPAADVGELLGAAEARAAPRRQHDPPRDRGGHTSWISGIGIRNRPPPAGTRPAGPAPRRRSSTRTARSRRGAR